MGKSKAEGKKSLAKFQGLRKTAVSLDRVLLDKRGDERIAIAQFSIALIDDIPKRLPQALQRAYEQMAKPSGDYDHVRFASRGYEGLVLSLAIAPDVDPAVVLDDRTIDRIVMFRKKNKDEALTVSLRFRSVLPLTKDVRDFTANNFGEFVYLTVELMQPTLPMEDAS